MDSSTSMDDGFREVRRVVFAGCYARSCKNMAADRHIRWAGRRDGGLMLVGRSNPGGRTHHTPRVPQLSEVWN